MKKYKLSIIMPAYNEGKGITNIIDKFISLQYENYELIIVDDGSTDCSPAILDEYSKNNEFIKVIHQNNQGCVFARKAGILQAKSEYITFADADDNVDSDYFVNFEKAIKYDADLYLLNNKLVNSNNDRSYVEKNFITDGYIDKKQAIRWILTNKAGAVWDKIYKTSIIKEAAKHLTLKIVFGEDVFINMIYADKANIIYCQDSSSYIHKRDSATSVCKQYTYKKLDEIDLLSSYILKNFNFRTYIGLETEFLSIVIYNYLETIDNLLIANKKKDVYAYLNSLESYNMIRDSYKPKGLKNKIYYLILFNQMTGLMKLVFGMKNWR